MNSHSKWILRGAIALVAVVSATSCGGSSGGGAATGKADWQKKHGAAVSAVSDDIDRSVQALNAGQQPDIRSACSQLQEDLPDARKAVPVPDPTVDAALRSALDSSDTAAKSCLEGVKSTAAAVVEQAQRDMNAARASYSKAQDAIAAWS